MKKGILLEKTHFDAQLGNLVRDLTGAGYSNIFNIVPFLRNEIE